MAVCGGTKRDGGACTLPATAGSPWCWNHDPARAEERKRNAAHAATTKHSKIDAEVRSVRLMTRDLVALTVSGELDLRVKKRLTEITQMLQVYTRLTELELSAGGRPKTSEPGERGLPEDTPEKAKEWAEKEGEKQKIMEGIANFNKDPGGTLKAMRRG